MKIYVSHYFNGKQEDMFKNIIIIITLCINIYIFADVSICNVIKWQCNAPAQVIQICDPGPQNQS